VQVRDQLTTAHEQEGIRSGKLQRGSLQGNALMVDCVVSTIGFPLVGELYNPPLFKRLEEYI